MTMTRIRRVALGAWIAGLMVASVAVAQTSEEVSFGLDGVTLVGTLSLPAGRGPHPAAVLLSGTGPQDRDGAIPGIDGYRPFAEISDVLVGAGVAVPAVRRPWRGRVLRGQPHRDDEGPRG